MLHILLILTATLLLVAAPALADSHDSGIDQLNRLRRIAGLPTVSADAHLTSGAQQHARYTAANGRLEHSQDPSLSYATEAGAASAARSNISLARSSTPFGVRAMIDQMHAAPFHGLLHLQPHLIRSGVGHARIDGQEAVVVDVRGGVDTEVVRAARVRAFPGPGSTTTIRRYRGGEYPDPLTPCSGWSAPTGAPVMVTFPTATPVDDVEVVGPDGRALELCWYDHGRYTNPDAAARDLGRNILAEQHALFALPREPLADGRHRVTLDLGDADEATWSFTVGNQWAPATGRVQTPAEPAPELAGTCPDPVALPFDDLTSSTHLASLSCALSWGLIEGTSASTFTPAAEVTRAQAASLLYRLVQHTDASLPDTAPGFSDVVPGSAHAPAIGALAAAGILEGFPDGTFAPDDPMTRAQYVSALGRALSHVEGTDLPDAHTTRFTDVAATSPHLAAIDHLDQLEIAQGTSTTTFAPREEVRRDQAAALLVRLAVHLHHDGAFTSG